MSGGNSTGKNWWHNTNNPTREPFDSAIDMTTYLTFSLYFKDILSQFQKGSNGCKPPKSVTQFGMDFGNKFFGLSSSKQNFWCVSAGRSQLQTFIYSAGQWNSSQKLSYFDYPSELHESLALMENVFTFYEQVGL